MFNLHMSDAAATKPPILSSAEIDELLSKTLIANLATLDNDGGIHILPMWFLRIGNAICLYASLPLITRTSIGTSRPDLVCL
jgi:nitroimidazol reductase NimA-like FMN-containing flavoprotein (pyridoxamine 5'-phosphate oxidase superfamily)